MSITAPSQYSEPSVAAQGGVYLWTVLRVYIEQAWGLFGSPAFIANQNWLPRRTHALLCDWLRALEMLLRRLILLDALTLTPEASRPHAGEAKRRARTLMGGACGACYNADDPDSWRAPFALAPQRVCAASTVAASPASQTARARAPEGMVGAAAVALRLEALARAYNAREHLAQRLANLLARAPALAGCFAAGPAKCDRAKPGFAPVSDAARLVAEALASPPRTDSS